MLYTFKVHREDSGYWAECLDVEGCYTIGNNIKKLKSNAVEALSAHIQKPVKISEIVFEFENLKES